MFVEKADDALKRDPPCYDVIKDLIANSQEFEIDLPQIPKLRRVSDPQPPLFATDHQLLTRHLNKANG